MSEGIHPAAGPQPFSSLPPKKKSPEELVVDKIRTSALEGPPIATAPKIGAKLTFQTLPEAMGMYLSVKGRLKVDTEFVAKAVRSFPLLFKILANIKEIPNPKTQKKLAESFLSIIKNHAGVNRNTPEYKELVEAIEKVLLSCPS